MQKTHRSSSKLLSFIIAGVLILLPFHAIATVWLSQHVGDYEIVRFWKDVVLIIAILPVIGISLRNNLISQQLLRSRLMWCIAAYILLQIVYAVAAMLWSDRGIDDIARVLIFSVSFLIFFLLCVFASNRNDWLRLYWRSIILLPALVVMAFGIFQVFGSGTQFLHDVGYADSPATMPVVVEGTDMQKMQSGQQNAEVLGGYLLIIVSALVVLIATRNHIRFWRVLMLLLAILCVFLVFSQSVWLAVYISIGLGAFLCTKTRRQRYVVAVCYALSVVALVLAVVLFGDSVIVQQVMLQPFFEHMRSLHVVGSLAAVIPTELSYMSYITARSGLLGLILMGAIIVILARGWWIERGATLNRVMLASLAGIMVLAMFGTVWADSTVAYIWWGLAGTAYGSQIARQKEREQRDEAHRLHKNSQKT